MANAQYISIKNNFFKAKEYKLIGDNGYDLGEFRSIFDEEKPLLSVLNKEEPVIKRYESFLILNRIVKIDLAIGVPLFVLSSVLLESLNTDYFFISIVLSYVAVLALPVLAIIARSKFKKAIKLHNKIQYNKAIK